ncbi:MAG: calcium-binding protein [Pseudomonadota bacterium]
MLDLLALVSAVYFGSWLIDTLTDDDDDDDDDNGSEAVSVGTEGSNLISGKALGEKIFGKGGDDALSGSGGDDEIFGGAGNDAVTGGAGDDFLRGGAGDDQVFGAGGNDVVLGDGGDDSVGGGAGDDIVRGGVGEDRLTGGTGDDLLLGGDGADTSFGGEGDDMIVGGQGNDTSNGGAGDDLLVGNFAFDLLTLTPSEGGETGGDDLFGGTGEDTIILGAHDEAEGGAGADVFAVLLETETVPSVSDFDTDEDEIVVYFDPAATAGLEPFEVNVLPAAGAATGPTLEATTSDPDTTFPLLTLDGLTTSQAMQANVSFRSIDELNGIMAAGFAPLGTA